MATALRSSLYIESVARNRRALLELTSPSSLLLGTLGLEFVKVVIDGQLRLRVDDLNASGVQVEISAATLARWTAAIAAWDQTQAEMLVAMNQVAQPGGPS